MIDVRVFSTTIAYGDYLTQEHTASESYASVCSFVLCDSGTFLKFWLEDRCRERLFSYLPKRELASLRLACHDFSVRAAPALFSDLSITFKAATFTRPARLAALDRLGFYVKTVHFNIPHTPETFLPPLVDSDTGEELSFTYTPQLQTPCAGRPKYGDVGTTEILTRQYPTLFHAATNVPAFIRAFSAFVNLQHLEISCPGYDPSTRYRRSIVDFALISARIAVEQNCLNALDTLILSQLHPSGLSYVSPQLGYGASPRSAKVWSRIQHLNITMSSPPDTDTFTESANFKLLQTYLRNFQANMATLSFCWLGEKGPLPVHRSVMTDPDQEEHPAMRQISRSGAQQTKQKKAMPHLHFPKLKHFEVGNVATSASQISTFVADHRTTIEDLNLEDVELTSGTWDEALAPLTRRRRPRTSFADIPIMLSPTATSPVSPTLPSPMERVKTPVGALGRPSLRISRWLSSRNRSKPVAPVTRKGKGGLHGCEEQIKKVLGGVLPWR